MQNVNMRLYTVFALLPSTPPYHKFLFWASNDDCIGHCMKKGETMIEAGIITVIAKLGQLVHGRADIHIG